MLSRHTLDGFPARFDFGRVGRRFVATTAAELQGTGKHQGEDHGKSGAGFRHALNLNVFWGG